MSVNGDSKSNGEGAGDAAAKMAGAAQVFLRTLDDLKVERIIAGADKDNLRSIALMERLGMTFTGAVGGDVDYVLHRPD